MVGFLSGTISEEKEKYLEPKTIPKTDGFSQAAFVEAVKSVDEPTPEAAKEARERLLETSTFLPFVGGVTDVAKTALDKESTLLDVGLAATSFVPGAKLARTALKKGDKFVPIFPKPERMAGVKGGQYIDTTTNTDITNKNIAKASISVSPEGKPSFIGDIKEVEKVGSVGKGKTQIKTNLFKKKAGWKWTKPVKGYEEAPTLISVQQKGKHYYTLNTNFPSGVNLKRYENLPSEPRLRPTLTGELDFGEAIGEISVRGKIHPVYDTIQAKEKGGMINMENGGMLGDLPPEAIANGNVIQGAPVGEVDVPGGGGPTDDGVPTQLPEGTFVLNAAAVEYHGTKHINDLIKNSVRQLIKEGVQISGQDINPDDDVPVAISNGEYIIPPEVAKKIGIKKLEDMNERGLEYREKQEEIQRQEAEEREQAMQSFMAQQMPQQQQAPIQSEQQVMAMADTPPMMNEGGEVEQRATMSEGGLAKVMNFLGNLLEEEQPNKNNSDASEAAVLVADSSVPFTDTLRRISPENLDKPQRIMGDPNNPTKPVVVPIKAQTGGTIERDPQSTFLAPQVARQAQGLQTGANTFPTSPQEPFLATPITGSVLENISNAMPQSLQSPASFVPFANQKKNPSNVRLGYQRGETVKPQFKPLGFKTAEYFARTFLGEDTSGKDHQLIADTIINRFNADKEKTRPNYLKNKIDDQKQFEETYSTFQEHMIDPETGNLVNRKSGKLVASKESINSLASYARKVLTSPPTSNATHYVTKELYNSRNAPSWTRDKRIGMINTGQDETSKHIFFTELTDRAQAEKMASRTPQVKPKNIMQE